MASGPEKDKVQRGKAPGYQDRVIKVVERRPYQGDSIPRMTGKRGVGPKDQRQMENVCGLHRPEQGLLEGLLPPAEH